jgi:hypothetical protein
MQSVNGTGTLSSRHPGTVFLSMSGTHANRRLFIADVEAVARRNVCRNNQFADAYVGPGLRRDDGCGWGSFEQADTAFVERCYVHFGARNDRRLPKGGILGLVPRTHPSASDIIKVGVTRSRDLLISQ